MTGRGPNNSANERPESGVFKRYADEELRIQKEMRHSNQRLPVATLFGLLAWERNWNKERERKNYWEEN